VKPPESPPIAASSCQPGREVRYAAIMFAAGCRLGFESPTSRDASDVFDSSPDDPVDSSGPDVAPGTCVQLVCAAAGGNCDGDTCVILQTAESAVTCPAGMPCRVECTGAGRPCRDGASCGAATTCELRCIGYRACQSGASCGTAPTCTVTCDGEEACESGITPGSATCTSHCCGLDACIGGVGSCANDAVCI